MKAESFAMIPLILAMSGSPLVSEKSAPVLKPPAPAKETRRSNSKQEALSTKQLAVQAGQIRLKTYKIGYSDPDELAETLPLMMPSTSHLPVKSIDRTLLVRGTAEQHGIVRQILRELDAPPKNIQVHVHFATSGGTHHREIGVRPDGPIVIRNGKVRGSLRGSTIHQRTTTRENTTQMLVAADGRSASIRVGETVPYITWLTEYGHRHGYVRDIGIEWRDVGSFLVMEPTIVGPGLIRVRLTPKLSGRLKNGSRQRIAFTHLSTEVTVRDGQTLSIGGFSEDRNFSDKFLIGHGGRSDSSVTGISLTPRILQ